MIGPYLSSRRRFQSSQTTEGTHCALSFSRHFSSFRISMPRRYKPYATVDPEAGAPDEPWTAGDAVSLVGADPFEQKLFRLSRLRIEGEAKARIVGGEATQRPIINRAKITPIKNHRPRCGSFYHPIVPSGDPAHGRPGKGMGGTMVPPSTTTTTATTSSGIGSGGDDSSCEFVPAHKVLCRPEVEFTAAITIANPRLTADKYRCCLFPADIYSPDYPLETVRSGRVEPPNIPPDLARRRRRR